MGEWQDISTAPKDGTRFWLIEEGSLGVFDAYQDDIGFWIADGGDIWPVKTPEKWQSLTNEKPLHPYFYHEWAALGNHIMCKKCGWLKGGKKALQGCKGSPGIRPFSPTPTQSEEK